MAEVSNSILLQVNTGILKKDACVVIVRTEWNAAIIDELEKGCIRILEQQGVKHIHIVNVPGAFEIPFGVKSYWDTNKYKEDRPDAFIALGCVLRGDTPISITYARVLPRAYYNLTSPFLYLPSLVYLP